MTKFKYLVVILTFFSFTKIYALDNIKINDGTLSPLFDKNIYEYNYYTNQSRIKISVSKNNNEIVTGYGYFDLKNGHNEFYVTSIINEKEYRYKLNVYKNYSKDNDSIATFKSLTVKDHDINFKNDVFEYTVDLNKESSLDISYELDSLSSVVEIKNNGNFTEENNDVLIYIKSKDGNNSNKYTIHVNKTIEVFKNKEEINEMSYVQKELAKILIIVVACSLAVLMYYLIFIKKILDKKITK